MNTLGQANRIAGAVNAGCRVSADPRGPRSAPTVCSVVDVYHLWWDEHLETDIVRAGADGLLGALHVCDWRVPTEDMLLDRTLMGEGRILTIRGEFGYWVFDGVHQRAQRPSWNYRREEDGGIMVDMFCHWRYVIDNLFGEITALSTLGARWRDYRTA